MEGFARKPEPWAAATDWQGWRSRPAGVEIVATSANLYPGGGTKAGMNSSFKTSLKICALAAICGTGLGLVTLQTGCAGSATKESTGEYVDDATITTKVKAAFVHDKIVDAGDISVETFKGTVQLSGFAKDAEQKSRAAEIARGVSGVRDVVNNITVK